MHHPGVHVAAEETLVSHFFYQIETKANDIAMIHRHPSGNGEWSEITWKDYGESAHRVARAFIAQGVKPGQIVAIYSDNRPEWNIAYFAALMVGACPFPIYSNHGPDVLFKLLTDAEAVLLVVENKKLMDRLKGRLRKLDHLQTLVIIEGAGDNRSLLSWPQLLQRGKAFPNTPLEQRLKELRQENRALIVCPSGATQPLRLVQLSHGNILSAGKALLEVVGGKIPEERLFCLQCLCHISQQLYILFFGMLTGATIRFLTNPDHLLDDLRLAKPTVFITSPQIWRQIWRATELELSARSGIFHFMMGAAGNASEAQSSLLEQKAKPKAGQSIKYAMGRSMVLSSVKGRMGLHESRYLGSTGSALPCHLEAQFLRLDLPIRGIYGSTECTGLALAESWEEYYRGKVGSPITDTEVRLGDDGDIQVKGPTVFMGYLNTWKYTYEVLKDDWLHTGDLGEIEDNQMRLVGHSEDIVALLGGHRMVPYAPEHTLNRVPELHRSMIYGAGQRYPIALISIDATKGMAWAHGRGANVVSLRELVKNQTFNHYIQAQIDAINEGLEPIERIEKYILLTAAFTVENGELTANYELRRQAIVEKYQAQIEKTYGEDWMGERAQPRRLHASH